MPDPEQELADLRAHAAALLLLYRQLHREARRAVPKPLSQDEVAANLGITRKQVRKHERRGLLKAARKARKILAENQP